MLDVARFESTEARRKSVQTRTQELQARRNAVSKEIGAAKGRGEDAKALMAEVAGLGEELKALETELSVIQSDLRDWLLEVPNLPHASVPIGASEAQNVELRRVGSPREFGFEARDHVDVGAAVGGIEFEISAKLSGSRFHTLRGNVARLHRALTQWMLDLHSAEHGYVECYVPYIVNRAALTGTGQLPKFEDDLFWVTKGWSGGRRSNVFDPDRRGSADQLCARQDRARRLRSRSSSPRIRRAFAPKREATARTPAGMFRVHQYDKVELVQIVHPDESYNALEELVGHAELVLQKLELPYRVVLLCTGDTGFASAKTYDLEVWLPGQGKYREISSCSNFEAFQARRMQARFRGAQGKPELVHTLNGSALAIGRTLIAVLENYQRADGGVEIPAVLQAYMAGMTFIPAAR